MAALALEELAAKIDQTLAAAAAAQAQGKASGDAGPKGGPARARSVPVKMKDGTQKDVELTADLCLGIGDDPEKLAKQLRSQGLDVQAVEIPRKMQPKEVVQWSESLNQSFTKAWIQKADAAYFIENACRCGEGLIRHGQPDFAYCELYSRYADRLLMLRSGEAPSEVDDTRRAGVTVRFYLGRCMALYQRVIQRDTIATRRDTVDSLRDVLLDLLEIMKYLSSFPSRVREELYWTVYNACLLALRLARWLRLQGFGGLCVQPLLWLAECMNTCAPFTAAHIQPFRIRFLEELIYCVESAQKLEEAAALCDQAVEQLEAAKKAEETKLEPPPPPPAEPEVKPPDPKDGKKGAAPKKEPAKKAQEAPPPEEKPSPLPKESIEVFETGKRRFKMLKVKYDLWLGKVAEASQAAALADELGGATSRALPCLLEALKIQHGLPERFGVQDGSPKEAVVEPEEVEGVTKFSFSQIWERQADIIEAIVSIVKPHLESLEAAAKALEDHTKARLAYEEEAERRASAEFDGDAPEPTPPAAPDEEKLQSLGFSAETRRHAIEDALPLVAHVALAKECLRHELLDTCSEKVRGSFQLVERSLALRLRYRHFLWPPLVDVDVIVGNERERSKVSLPETYEFLSEDLNSTSPINAEIYARPPPKTPYVKDVGPKPKHVFVIGKRFNAWDSWSPTFPHAAAKRICNLRVVFAKQLPAPKGTPTFGMQHPKTMDIDGSLLKPWMEPYQVDRAADGAGFDHAGEADQTRDQLLQQLVEQNHLAQGSLSLPLDLHPQAVARGQKAPPLLVFDVYDEAALWEFDKAAAGPAPGTPQQQTLHPDTLESPAEEQPPTEESDQVHAGLNSEAIVPPWCPLLDKAQVASTTVVDLNIFLTERIYASPPAAKFNALIRTDLRRTPDSSFGSESQSYAFVSVAVDAPSTVFVSSRLRVLRALHALHLATVKAAETTTDGEGEGDVLEGQQPKHAILDRLLEFAECIERVSAGECGRLFLLDAADLLEDVCAHVFLSWVWPQLGSMQERWQQHELGERVVSEAERVELTEWSVVLRRVLPLLLTALGQVQAIDGMTLASAAYAYSRLQLQAREKKSGQVELARAIERLERDLAVATTPGHWAALDLPVSACVSFDPPSLRSPNYALFDEEGEAATLVLQPLPRLIQDRLCMLTRLYASWIDLSLRAHLKGAGISVKRAAAPGDPYEHLALLEQGSSKRLALSNPEAVLLSRLGENPYLRCFFFLTVARRRPEAAGQALSKACEEAEKAVTQELELWAFCEKELDRQQQVLRDGEEFEARFRKKQTSNGKKLPAAHPPLPFSRSPGAIRLRTPPLLGSQVPPRLASSVELEVPVQEYSEQQHSERLQRQQRGKWAMACSVFGKATGTGTSVSEQHCDLRGTGVRRPGFDSVEITGIRPNTNYSFAALYYEGFDTLRPAMSSISETSATIGSYYPLPVALLRAEICKVALAAGEVGADAFKNTWPVFFGSFCEYTTAAEELDSCGLRTYKLRLDVADRLPPAVLTAFAELILLKNSPNAGTDGKGFPCTRQVQLGVLRSANECMLAVDCARRAGDANACLRGVSLTLHMVARLLQLRTKPHPLLSMLMKCSSALEAFQPLECRVAWYAKSRVMAMSLIHYITLMGVQLRQTEVLQKLFAADLPERYTPDALCDPRARATTEARVLDQALELALLGADGWAFAEAKAKVALGSHSSAEELLRLLKVLSDYDYASVVRDAAALVLQDEAARHPFALSLLLCAAGRSWEKGGIAEPLSEVLGKHSSAAMLEQLLTSASDRLSSHGFVVRSLPPFRLQELEAKEAAAKEAEAEAALNAESPQEGETEADPAAGLEDGGAPSVDPAAELERHPDTAALAQLELFQAGPLLSELCGLRFHKRDIATFRFLDLQQVTVPELLAEEMPPEESSSPDVGAADAAAPASETPQADGAEGQPEREIMEWEKHESEDRQSREKAFDLLRRLLRKLARAGAYANSTRADRLLQRVLTTALNGLLIAEPNPEECVPPGVKGDPKDLDAERFVGADLFTEEKKVEEPPPPPEPEDPKAKKGKDAKDKKGKEPAPVEEVVEAPAEPETNDIWLNLALLADQAIIGLSRLKNGGAEPEASAVDDTGTENEEVALIRRAEETARALQSAGDAANDPWWEKVPDLDITSIAKLIAFALQCMYHMRRWETVLSLARRFNDVTCSVFSTSFLPIIVGAQREVVKLAGGALANTERYLSTSKEEFEVAQKSLPKKVTRQLALTGQASEPEKLWGSRRNYYGTMLKRQTDFHAALDRLLGCFEATSTRAIKGVPAEVEQLRKSRIVLGELLRDRQALTLGLRDGSVSEEERPLRERALRLAAVALTSSYRKAVDMFRKRKIYDQVVHALHELGNLQWLEGDAAGAQSSWSDGVDTAFQHVYVIKTWQACSVEPPQDWARTESMLLALVLLAKYARLATPKDVTSHLDVALFASNIVEALLTTSLPHPSKRSSLSPDSYRLREIFYGLRESRAVLPPNSVYGGVDSPTFLGALAFFHNTLLSTDYQQARCVPICALYNYIATEVCRDSNLALKGRLMMARGLIRCRSLSSAWIAMYTASRNHDRPRSLLGNEDLDRMVVEAAEVNGLSPYRVHEEPFTEANVAAASSLLEFEMVSDDAPVEDDGTQADPKAKAKAKADPKAKAKAKADPKSGKAEPDPAAEVPGPVPAGTPEHHFRFLQAEFLLSVCRFGHVSAQPGDVGSKQQKEWLEKVDDILSDLWRDVTGNEDDAEAWALQMSEAQAEQARHPSMATPINVLNEETAELCVEMRLLRADGSELRGDTARAVREVLYAMHFLQLLARPPETGGAGGRYRAHPGAQLWGRLRRRMVQLLVAQGRHGAALSHIEQGLKECQATHDEMTRVDLLATRARLDILGGRFLELRGDGRFGAVPTLQGCLEIARKALPLATPSSVRARMMLCSLLEQNPTLADMGESDGLPAKHKGDPEPMDARKREEEPEDPHEEMNLLAQGKIIVSPIAKELRTRSGMPPPDTLAQAAVERQQHLARLMRSCVDELGALLAVEECDLNPPNLNGVQQIGEPSSRERPPLKTFPSRNSSCLLEQATSDSREPPNMYLDLMPLRLHCELRLASLQLRLGELDAVGALLREAEVRMTRCANLLPWLFVQFCVLKLQWRRLARPCGPPPVDAANTVWYRDETAFADGVCPPTSSPLFRTFLKRARVPLQIEEGEWQPRSQPPVAGSQEALQTFLQEVVAAMQIGMYEGGHDVGQLASLAREGLEEVLTVKKFQPESSPEHLAEAATVGEGEGGGEAVTEAQDASSPAKAYDAVHALFCCLVALAESRKALRFRDPLAPEEPAAAEKGGKDAKGGKKDAGAGVPGAVDASALPLRVALDIQRHIKRQPFEGGLAYSEAAQKELEKSVPFKTVVKHIEAIQQECATFDSVFHSERLVCDRLHVALARASDAYAKAKVLDADKLKALESPPQIPASGHMLVHWIQPDLLVPEPGVYDLPPSECCEFLMLVCPLGEDPETASKPFVARCPDVPRAALRQLADGLASDLAHCRPASAVSSEYVEQRLRSVASVLRGARFGGVEAKEIVSKQAEPALKELLEVLAMPSASAEEPAVATKKTDPKKDPKKAPAPTPGQSRPPTGSPEQMQDGMLDSGNVQGLLEALVRLLDVGAVASRVAHPELGHFLQAVLSPLRLAPARLAPA